MKAINKTVLILLFAVGAASVFTSCKKNDSIGTPTIDYIRVTNPQSSDSLLVGAGQGQLIAIIGNDLQHAVEVWFNDQQARLTPSYITNNSILVSVPNQIPDTVTNQLKIVFSNGYTLLHDFNVEIGEPVLNSMDCEYVNEGDIAIIRGNFFYKPLSVVFTGGATGELVSVTDQEIQVRVPAGAQPGPVSVKTNFGVTASDFWFRDNRNLLITSDPWSGWWGQDLVVSGSDPLAISGNFLRIQKNIGEWAWTEFAGGKEDALAGSHNIPDDAVLNSEKYYMKFEINTLKPYDGNRIKFMIGQVDGPDPNWDTEPYFWEPPYDTKGKWQTVIIPFNEVIAKNKTAWGVRPQGYGVKIWFHGPGVLDADIAFDNLRVVPKVNK